MDSARPVVNPVSPQFAALGDLGWIHQAMRAQVANTQDAGYFRLAAVKAARLDELRRRFDNRPIERVVLSGNLDGFECQLPGRQVELLAKGWFERIDDSNLAACAAQLRDALVIVNNNDVGLARVQPLFAGLVDACPHTLFAAWDWDNHHWLELSSFLAAHCDLYCPAHHENLYLLSRFNWLTAGPVYCATVQWSRAFLAEHADDLLRLPRSTEPLGMHIPYNPFRLRLQIITTLSQHYPTIGFSDHRFHGRSAEDRWREWCGHRLHWIVPVLNDVPIRLFDALSSGGIPIVPAALRLLPPVAAIPPEHILFYGPADVVAPQGLVEKGLRLFEQGGAGGILARHRLALELHHGDCRIAQITAMAERLLQDA